MDRHWLITWTTYGTWLPGDKRGFVGKVRTGDKTKTIHNIPGTPVDSNIPNLKRAAAGRMKSAPVKLTKPQAQIVSKQFQETADHRGWKIFAGAVMANHVHLVVGVPGDPEPKMILQDLKSYASRVLNRSYAQSEKKTWWTKSGSVRKLPNENAVQNAVHYVLAQEYPLIVWEEPGA